MSKPPKSTIRAPLARWTALRGVVFGMGAPESSKRRRGDANRFAPPRLSFYLRDCGGYASRVAAGAPSVGRITSRPLSRSCLPRVRPFCLSGCGDYAFGGAIAALSPARGLQRITARPRPGRAPARYCYFLSARMRSTIFLASASLTCVFGGIGTGPHTPEPPFLTLSVSFAAAEASPLYFAATSLYEGPITFLSSEWQALQPFFFIMSSSSSATATEAMASVLAASSAAANFIVAPGIEIDGPDRTGT